MNKFLLTTLSAAVILSGCASVWRTPMPEVKMEFKAQTNATQVSKEWWKEFKDENLNELIERAFKSNSNLAIALNNLDIARINLNIAKADYLPNFNLQGSGARAKTSAQSAAGLRSGGSAIGNAFSLSAVLSYEVDLWGRVRNSVAAKKETFAGSVYDYEGAKVSIAAGVAEAYFNLVMLGEQEEILKKTLTTYESTYAYRQNQRRAGAINEVVALQAKASVDSAKVQLLDVQTAKSSAASALAVLVGASLDEILNADVKVAKRIAKSPEVPSGLSTDILQKRADVASALQTLKASNALTGVARANWLPRLSLTGLFGFESMELGNLFKSNAVAWSGAASAAMPLLDWGKTYNGVELAELSQNAAFLNYQQVVKNAFSEVHTALVTRKNALAKERAMEDYFASVERIYNLTKSRYNAGAATHLDFLDAQRQFLSVHLSLASTKLAVATSAIGVFKAFGGGFESEATQNATNSSVK